MFGVQPVHQLRPVLALGGIWTVKTGDRLDQSADGATEGVVFHQVRPSAVGLGHHLIHGGEPGEYCGPSDGLLIIASGGAVAAGCLGQSLAAFIFLRCLVQLLAAQILVGKDLFGFSELDDDIQRAFIQIESLGVFF